VYRGKPQYIQEEREMTAYTVQELFDIIKNLPANAEIEINGHQGVDLFFAKTDNVLCLDNPY
jgi:hypothetical protein